MELYDTVRSKHAYGEVVSLPEGAEDTLMLCTSLHYANFPKNIRHKMM